MVWHAALHYTVGSLLFVIASFAALFVTVRETPSLKRCVTPLLVHRGACSLGIVQDAIALLAWHRKREFALVWRLLMQVAVCLPIHGRVNQLHNRRQHSPVQVLDQSPFQDG